MAGEQYLIGNISNKELSERAIECRNTVVTGMNKHSTIDDFHKFKSAYDELRSIEKELNLRARGERGVTKLGRIVRDDFNNVVGILDANGLHTIDENS